MGLSKDILGSHNLGRGRGHLAGDRNAVHILQCIGQPPQQRIISPKMLIALRLRKRAFPDFQTKLDPQDKHFHNVNSYFVAVITFCGDMPMV